MARKPINYWEKRQTELMLNIEKQTNGTIQNLITAYNDAKNDIQKEIVKIFNKYATDGKLTFKEAQQLLNTKESKQFYNNLLKKINTINDVEIKRKLLAKYNAPAYSYRIARYQALQDNIDIELSKLVEKENVITKKHYVKTIREGYYNTIFNIQKGINIGFNFSQIDNRTINLILNENWYNTENFSIRIWKNSGKLGDYLKKHMLPNAISEKSVQRMSQELDNIMNMGLYNATRLVRTETNHFANEAEMLSYEECGIEKYRFIATLDNVTCEHCSELDNRVFNVKDRQANKNYPPIHANDRCTTIAEFDDDVIKGLTRKARDENENPILVSQDTSYQEWYNKYVTNNNKNDIIEKIPKDIKDFYNYYKEKTDKILTPSNLNKIIGYDKLPTIVSKEEFNELAKNNKYGILERGFKTGKGTLSIDKIIDNYKKRDFYVGEGIYGSGTYTAYGENAHKIALSYASDNEKFSVEDNVVQYLLKDDAKVIKYNDLRKMRDEELDKLIKDNGFKDYFDVIENGFKNIKTTEISKYIIEMQDAGVYASIKGYDAIDTFTDNVWGDENSYIVILNRKKMIMYD